MAKSIKDITKKRGRPVTTGKGEGVLVRLQPPQIATLDAWIALQPEPRPTRPEAIRRLLADGLAAQPPSSSIEQKIARAKRKIADNPPADAPSPKAGMATLRRGLAQTKLRALKAKKRGGDGA